MKTLVICSLWASSIVPFAAISACNTATTSAATPATNAVPVTAAAPVAAKTFATDVLPIFRRQCLGCHGAENPAEGINLSTLATTLKGGEHGKIVIVGKPEESKLVKSIKKLRGAAAMPPGRGQGVSAANIAIIEAWIKDGAK